jgi:transcriptional regulator with XRE-family HTH domain
MKNIDLTKRIKELRTHLGYSQAELADHAKLSLRTVQRIENGEAKPRGYTLQSLAAALKITPDELTEWEEKSDKLFLVMLNLSALSFIMFPLLGVFVPLILWILKRNEVKSSGDMGRKILNFQITWFLLFAVGYVCFMASGIGFKGTVFTIGNYLIFIGGLYLLNILAIIINAIKVQYDKPVKYFIAIPFLR